MTRLMMFFLLLTALLPGAEKTARTDSAQKTYAFAVKYGSFIQSRSMELKRRQQPGDLRSLQVRYEAARAELDTLIGVVRALVKGETSATAAIRAAESTNSAAVAVVTEIETTFGKSLSTERPPYAELVAAVIDAQQSAKRDLPLILTAAERLRWTRWASL